MEKTIKHEVLLGRVVYPEDRKFHLKGTGPIVLNFKPPKEVHHADIFWLPNYINQHKGLFAEANVEEGVIWINWRGIQGNMEFSNRVIKEIAKTGMDLAIDYTHLKGKSINGFIEI